MTEHTHRPLTAISDANDQMRPFRFFELPRELRDWCYDYMIGPTVGIKVMRTAADTCSEFNGGRDPRVNDRVPETSIKAPPIINLLCISQQFKNEYEDRASKQTTLIVSDHNRNCWEDLSPQSLGIKDLIWTNNVQYLGMLRCERDCRHLSAVSDAERTAKWIRSTMAKMSKSSKIRVDLALNCEVCNEGCNWHGRRSERYLRDALQMIAATRQVMRLQVFRGGPKQQELDDVPSEDQLYVRWNEANGWYVPKSAK